MSFTYLAHIDTWAVSASLIAKRRLFDEGPLSVKEASLDWRQMATLMRRIMLLPQVSKAVLSEMCLHRVDPRGDTGWGWSRPTSAMAYLSLWTNPMAYVFCGTAAQHMPIGSMWLAPPTWPHCAVNWGDTAFYFMTAEVRAKNGPPFPAAPKDQGEMNRNDD